LQELLSGIREKAQFIRLQEILEGFPIILATQQSHLEAAQIANACRSRGVAVSTVDCLIAAMTIELSYSRMMRTLSSWRSIVH